MDIVLVTMPLLLIIMLFAITRLLWLMHLQISDLRRSQTRLVLSVSNMIGDEHAAEVLREASRAYESIEEKQRLDFLSRTEYQPGGPSMPALWLRDRAETLAPRSYLDEVVERTLDGKIIR